MLKVICVIGHGVNLIPHFIKHYKGLYVDEINFVVYESDLHPNLRNQVEDFIEGERGVNILDFIYDRIFDWERVTKEYNKFTAEEPDTWWIVADIDEFHLYPFQPRKITVDCEKNGWEIVRGGFIDRIGENGKFPRIKSEEDIFGQFPLAGFFRYPMSGACPNKICIKKGNVEITPGQHYAKINGHVTWGWQGWSHPLIAPIDEYSVQVHHFKWDYTCLERIKAVVEVGKDYSFSDEYKVMYDSIIKNRSRIDADNSAFMFERDISEYNHYKNWKKLIKIIISI
jgi:hypothetical protein